MTPSEIKLERTAHILKELIPEAIAQLSDTRLHGLNVIEVKVAKGKSDAKVYLDPAFVLEEEKPLIIKQLQKARPIIEEYCMTEQGWFRTPKLSFFFDDTLAQINHIEKIFEQIKKDKS